MSADRQRDGDDVPVVRAWVLATARVRVPTWMGLLSPIQVGQGHWSISLALVQKKYGSNSTEKEFRRLTRAIVRQDEDHSHFPDYAMTMTGTETTFTNRCTGKKAQPRTLDLFSPNPQIKDGTLDQARKAAPGYDVHNLLHEWTSW